MLYKWGFFWGSGADVTSEMWVNVLVERYMAQWLERGALPMSRPAVRFRTPLSAGFLDKSDVFPLLILGYCFDVVSLGKALHPQILHLTHVKISTCRTKMTMCTISSMRRNGYMTVCSLLSTQMDRSSDQG